MAYNAVIESFNRFVLFFFSYATLSHRALNLVINKIMIKCGMFLEVENISYVKCIDLKIHPGDEERIKIPQPEMRNIFYSLTLTMLRAFFIRADAHYSVICWMFYIQLTVSL